MLYFVIINSVLFNLSCFDLVQNASSYSCFIFFFNKIIRTNLSCLNFTTPSPQAPLLPDACLSYLWTGTTGKTHTANVKARVEIKARECRSTGLVLLHQEHGQVISLGMSPVSFTPSFATFVTRLPRRQTTCQTQCTQISARAAHV